MNRRQFTQSLAALFATPVLPGAALATPATALPPAAYCWADYLTRLHNVCTPDMLSPFFRSDAALAKTIHSQLVAENFLTTSGHAHPSLLARQPTKTFGQAGAKGAHSLDKTTGENPVRSTRKPTMPEQPKIRAAQPEDHDAMTDIWYTGWVEAHADHVPATLVELRSKDSFHTRLNDMIPTTIVSGPIGQPTGFCAIKNNEIYQMYVGTDARGTGAAAALISAGCDAIKKAGHATAKLDVIAQNTRARAFYTKMGWVNQGLQTVALDTLEDPFELDCIVMTKDLR